MNGVERGRIVAIGDRVPQGSTFPIYGVIETPDGERTRAVIKFPIIEKRVPPEAILNEWVATRLARMAGIEVSDCWLAELEDAQAAAIEERFGISVASRLCFTSRYMQIDSFVYPYTFRNVAQDDALRLFLFDMLFLNTDRIPENPNCGQRGGRLFAYDFGSALPAPRTFPSRFDRFFFPPNLTERAQAHLCSGAAMISNERIDQFVEILDKMSRDGLAVAASLPHSDHALLLSHYFTFLSEEREMLIRQIGSVV